MNFLAYKHSGLICVVVGLGAAWYFPKWMPAIAIAVIISFLLTDSIRSSQKAEDKTDA